MSFPVGASVGDKYTLGNIQYEFNGTAWDLVGSVAGNAVEELENNKLNTSDLLAAIKEVDGSGSGLDADKLDGLNSTQLLRSDVNDETIGTLTVGTTFNVKGSSNRHVYLRDEVGHQRALFYHDDKTDTAHLRLYSPDGNSVITDLALKPSGEFSFNQSISMVSGAWIFFEDGKHCITNNDGGGNFNIRVGCSPSANSKITEGGYGGHLTFDQSSGTWSINASATSQNIGDDFSSTSLLALSNTKCNFKNQPIWFGQQTSSSKGSNGYQKLPSGVIFQWVASVAVDAGATVTVTFPIAFPNATYTVQATNRDDGGSDYALETREYSKTQVEIYNASSHDRNATLFIIGY